MKPILALSTCWCSARHTDGYAMLREIADLGFSYVELSHGIRITLVPGILKALGEGVIKVSSTHNFCPLPTEYLQAAPNAFEPSASDATEHEQWLRQTKRSLDFAQQVRARVLVMHLGSVRFWSQWFDPVRRMLAYAEARREAGGAMLGADERFILLRDKARKKLRARVAPFIRQVEKGLEAIREDAVARGVSLGLENRELPNELPLDDDFEALFARLVQPNTAGYWHDTGHAQIKEQLALLNHREFLEKHAEHLLGFHLHDTMADGRDHQPLGAGQVDFEMVSRFWRPHHVLVLELGPRVDVKDVKNSKIYIESLMRG